MATLTPDFLVRSYTQSGFSLIGGGMYSKVYGRPGTDWCIKVGRHLDGYLAFTQLAIQKGWIGTHAPYIYSIKVMDGFYITIMERLAVCVSNTRGTAWDMASTTQGSCEWQDRVRWISVHVNEMRNLGHKLHLDTHNGNWMLRHDGSLVIIDPIAGATAKPLMTRWINPNKRQPTARHPLLAQY